MMLICETCHFTFPSDKKSRKYCSLRCAQRARRHRVTLRCRKCGQTFEAKWAERNRRKYCGRACRGRMERKAKRPTKDQLQHLIERKTYPEIGAIYDVAATTVGKWVAEYGLRSPNKKVVDVEDRRKDAHHKTTW